MPNQSYKGPLDYIDVATRIVEFREKHPDGSLQQQHLEFVEVAGQAWVVYTAAAYRSPDDIRPGVGTAWEPVPGKTNFTRDSELQNAETAAWGRAIVAALAADTKKGIASSEEVRNRQGDNAPQQAAKPAQEFAEAPAGWKAMVDESASLADLQEVYEVAAKGRWFSPQVRAAFTVRKQHLEQVTA